MVPHLGSQLETRLRFSLGRTPSHSGEVPETGGKPPARQMVIMLPALDAVRFYSELADVMADGRPSREALSAFGAPWGVGFLGAPIRATL